jgi:type III pantothenate kinase
MNLCLDIGNTLTKAAVFENDILVYSGSFSHFDLAAAEEILRKYGVEQGIISSVREDDPVLFTGMADLLARLIILRSDTKIPVINTYKTPETLGKDRLAAVVGANYMYPGKNILVVDAGSAITFDFISEAGIYRGGNIAPGLSMRFRALHEYTRRLPLLEPGIDPPLLGTTTGEAIVAGVQNGILFETLVYIQELQKECKDLITLVTGGDAKFFDNKLKNVIFVIPDLVLIGLNRILNFNA